MTGHRKRPIMPAADFADDMEAAHNLLTKHTRQMRVGMEPYTLVAALDEQLIQTLEKITGKRAPWVYRSIKVSEAPEKKL